MIDRIKYYSKNDKSAGTELKNAEKILESFDFVKEFSDINDIIELYNIKLFFDNDVYLSSWDDNQRNIYYKNVQQFSGIIGKFFSKINDNNLSEFYILTDGMYQQDFWEIVQEYKVYTKISKDVFCAFVDTNSNALGYILMCKKVVCYFDAEIAEKLSNNVQYAELVLDYFIVKHDLNRKELYIPNKLTKEMQKQILNQYIGWEQAHPNYLLLIANLKKHDSFYTDDRIRYGAYKKYQEFWENKESDNNITYHTLETNVSFTEKKLKNVTKLVYKNGVAKFVCDKSWITENLDYPTLMNNFIYLFRYTDLSFRCLFLSNPSEMGVLERVFCINGKRQYKTGASYEVNKMLTVGQTEAYINILLENNIKIESLFKWFFEEYLNSEFNVSGFNFIVPSDGASFYEKNLVLISQLDSIIKQFKLYIEDGHVDREYFEFASTASKISDSESMSNQKYIYPYGEDIYGMMNSIYSDQSMLTYDEKTRTSYNSLIELLENHNRKIEDFNWYNEKLINWLIEKEVLFTNEQGFLSPNKTKAYILEDLFHRGVICYSYLTKTQKTVVDDMIKSNDLVVENTLFSRMEQEYIDYMLNVQKFNNGPEIRNKYAHGTNSLNERTQKQHYIELIKIIVLTIIKINEEFCLKYPQPLGIQEN